MEELNSDGLETSSTRQRKDASLESKTERLKPPHSYIALIATAILNSPGKRLTLTEINEYLVQHYAFFRGPYQGWKNSVRHNLSFNKCFVKILRDPARPWGKDNYWTVSSLHDYLLADGTFRRRRRRKPKRRDERNELGHNFLAEQVSSPRNDMREFGMHDMQRNILMMPTPFEAVRAHSAVVHGLHSPAAPKQFQGSFSIDSILADEKTSAKDRARARRTSETFPVTSVLNPNIGSFSASRNVVHYCRGPTHEEPSLHYQRPEHLCTPVSPNAFTSGCGGAAEMWTSFTCQCYHSCTASTHFHACY